MVNEATCRTASTVDAGAPRQVVSHFLIDSVANPRPEMTAKRLSVGFLISPMETENVVCQATRVHRSEQVQISSVVSANEG